MRLQATGHPAQHPPRRTGPLDRATTALSLGVAAATAASAVFGTARTPAPTEPPAPMQDTLENLPPPLVRIDPPPRPETAYASTIRVQVEAPAPRPETVHPTLPVRVQVEAPAPRPETVHPTPPVREQAEAPAPQPATVYSTVPMRVQVEAPAAPPPPLERVQLEPPAPRPENVPAAPSVRVHVPMPVPRPHNLRTATVDVSQLVVASRAAEKLAASVLVPPAGLQAVAVARTFLGSASADLRGRLPHFQAAGGADNNCADFVSSVLRGQGLLRKHYTYVPSLEHGLRAEGYVRVPAAQARPGDVWIDHDRGHTQLVATPGATTLIGSNNNGRDWQSISEGPSWGGIIYQKR